jgi:hypothetical protein
VNARALGLFWWVVAAYGGVVLFVLLLREQWWTALAVAFLLGVQALIGRRRSVAARKR